MIVLAFCLLLVSFVRSTAVTDFRTQLRALWLPEYHHRIPYYTDDRVKEACRNERALLLARVMNEFGVQEDVADALLGNWSVDRIRHVKEGLLATVVFYVPLENLTMAYVARFLPEGWHEVPLLLEGLKSVLASMFRTRFHADDSRSVYRALGDFSDARIRHFKWINWGEGYFNLVSRREMFLYLGDEHIDAELEAFLLKIMKWKAMRLLGLSDFDEQRYSDQVVALAVGYFVHERIEYLRYMISNHWIHRPATLPELTYGLPEESLNCAEAMQILQIFRLKIFIIHQLIALQNRLEELDTQLPRYSPREVRRETLDYIQSNDLQCVVHNYNHKKKWLEDLQSGAIDHTNARGPWRKKLHVDSGRLEEITRKFRSEMGAFDRETEAAIDSRNASKRRIHAFKTVMACLQLCILFMAASIFHSHIDTHS